MINIQFVHPQNSPRNSALSHLTLFMGSGQPKFKQKKLQRVISDEQLHFVPDAHDYLKSSGFSQSLLMSSRWSSKSTISCHF